MSSVFKCYGTSGLMVYLKEIAPQLEGRDATYTVEVKDSAGEALRTNQYDNLDDALFGFDQMVKNVDKLIWEEDSNSTEEFRKC